MSLSFDLFTLKSNFKPFVKNDAFVGWGTSDSVAPRTSQKLQKLQGDLRGCQYSPPPKKYLAYCHGPVFLGGSSMENQHAFPHTHFYSQNKYIYIFAHAFTLAYDKSATLPRALLALGMSQICFFFFSRNLSWVGIAPPPLTILVLIITAHHPRPRLPKRPWPQP